MKKISSILILFLLIFKTSIANTYDADPKIFIEELLNDAINKLSDKNIDKEEKKEFVKKIALENVDIKALGLYTLFSRVDIVFIYTTLSIYFFFSSRNLTHLKLI